MKILCNRQPWNTGIDISISERYPTGRLMLAERLTFRDYVDGEWIEPVVKMTNQEAQELMDDLWRCGLRPTEGAGSAGSLAATERHLKDMQDIARAALCKAGVSISKA